MYNRRRPPSPLPLVGLLEQPGEQPSQAVVVRRDGTPVARPGRRRRVALERRVLVVHPRQREVGSVPDVVEDVTFHLYKEAGEVSVPVPKSTFGRTPNIPFGIQINSPFLSGPPN